VRPTAYRAGVSIEAVVFDFDGVIIDSEVTNFQAWSETFARFGTELTTREYVDSMGGRHLNIYGLLTRKADTSVPDETSLRAVKRARHLELLAATDVLPGVADWIAEARLRKMGVAIASSGDPSWVEDNLARVGLGDSFDCICCCDGELPPKPAPDLFLRACERLGVPPSAALAVEDSPTGLLAAQMAGMRTVAVIHRLTLDVDLVADVVVQSLRELSLGDVVARL
jgi:HAD superfamily hydrolase (TIGR01509 family)